MKPLDKQSVRIFLCGDVMTGRGIDQILTHPNHPNLYEAFVNDAREYVLLAETRNGKIQYPVSMDYIWGDALPIWEQFQPNIKIINLETAVTENNEYWPRKGIHYRMHPRNIAVLTAAGIDVCTLANNHILDWGYAGLMETCATLQHAQIQYAGAGENIKQAMQPAMITLSPQHRILIFAVGMESSGVYSIWQATAKLPGIYYLDELNEDALISIAKDIKQYKQPGDLVIFSIHWGSNWGYEIPQSFRVFAHGLIDSATVDVIFGHSSHHPRPIEIYNNKPILYGCGDFINDYEGIGGYEIYRGNLSLMYFLDFDSSSLKFKTMTLVPMEIKKMSLHRANITDCKWMQQTINQSSPFAAQFKIQNQCLVYGG